VKHDPDAVAPVSADITRVQSLTTIVRERIISGVYRPGSWIREVELQREFGVSNGPVREALQAAVADGLAERAPFRGVRVIDLSEREIVELFEVRFALLGHAAELAAERTSPELRASAAALKARLANLNATDDAADVWLHGDFSHWVLGAAGNARLAEAYERTLVQSLLYVAVARKHDGERDVLLPNVHAVIDAIVHGEPAAARAAVRTLTLQTLHYLRSSAHADTPARP
jgi:DNA-binding GntR family transcriptional regulator